MMFFTHLKRIYPLYFILLLFIAGCPATLPQHEGCYVDDPDIRGTYTGDCQDNKAHGFGKAVGKDTYEGEFVEGVIEGQGTYIWNNGNRYVGTFKQGERHGRGVKIYQDGRRVEEQWDNGKLIQE